MKVQRSICLMLLFACTTLAMGQGTLTGAAIPTAQQHQLYYTALAHLSSALLNDNLTNNVGLSPADVAVAAPIIAQYQSNVNAAISQYNLYVAHTFNNTAAYNSLMNSQAQQAASTQAALQANLSSAGYAALEASLVDQSKGFTVTTGNDPMIGMLSGIDCTPGNWSYGATQMHTLTVVSQNPVHVKLTFTYTLTGSATGSGTQCSTVHHTSTVTQSVGSLGGTVSQGGSMLMYFDTVRTDVLDSGLASGQCVLDSTMGCTDYYNATMYCAAVQRNLFQQASPKLHWILAHTMTIYTGYYSDCSLGSPKNCNFKVNNYCTASTTPPDLDMNGKNIWQAWPPVGFYNVWSICVTTTTNVLGQPIQPFSCSYGWSMPEGNTQPLAACSSHR